MGTLNRSKHFGIVCGIAPWRYEQEGKKFNEQGEEVDATGNLVLPPPKPPKEESPEPPLTTDPAGQAGAGDPIVPVPDPNGTVPAGSGTPVDDDGGSEIPTREEIIAKLEEANIPHNPKSRRSKLWELLKGAAGE